MMLTLLIWRRSHNWKIFMPH